MGGALRGKVNRLTSRPRCIERHLQTSFDGVCTAEVSNIIGVTKLTGW